MNQSNPVTSTTSIEKRIEGKIDTSTTQSLIISEAAGGMAFAHVGQVMEFAKLMSVSQVAIPKFLRGNPGACVAVTLQAVEWRMSPFAVANKSYSVNDRIAYEAQLLQAVILQRAPIKGRIKVEYLGEGDKRVCRVWANLLEDGETVEYKSPELGKINPKNSPLWKNDPDQQLFYFSVRSLARRHFPDIILGVYAKDELEDNPHIGPDRAKDVTPSRPTLSQSLDHLSALPDDVNCGTVKSPLQGDVKGLSAVEAEADFLNEESGNLLKSETESSTSSDADVHPHLVTSEESSDASTAPKQEASETCFEEGYQAALDQKPRRAPASLRDEGKELELKAWFAGYDKATDEAEG